MSAGLRRRRGRRGSGLRVGDQVLVAHGFVAESEFEHSVEHHSPAAGTVTIEAGHELVQVAEQVGLVHRALVGAQQPPFRQRGDPVHRGQQPVGILSTGAGGALAAPVVDVAELVQPVVALPCVGDDPGARLDVICDEGVQRGGGRISQRPSGTGRALSALEPPQLCR